MQFQPANRSTTTTWPTWSTALLAALLYEALALAVTWPLPLHFTTQVPGWVNDNHLFAWLVEWFYDAVWVRHQSPLWVPYLNYPEGWRLAYTDPSPLSIMLAVALSRLGGSTAFGLNVASWLTFGLSGLAGFLWGQQLTRQRLAAFFTGLVFAFAPYRLTRLLVHFSLLNTHWLMFYFYALTRSLTAETPRRRDIAWIAIFIACTALTSAYYFYILLVLTPVYISGWVWLNKTPRERLATSLWGWVWATPAVIAAFWPYFILRLQSDLPVRSLEEVRMWSASLTDFVVPGRLQWLLGKWAATTVPASYPWVEMSVFLGWTALALAGVACLKHWPEQRPALAIALTGGVAVILALGVEFRWFGSPVMVLWPGAAQPTPLPMPGRWLFEYAPFYSTMRAWVRYGILAMIMVSGLAGLGLAWWLTRLRPVGRWIITILLSVLVLIEVWPRAMPLTSLQRRSADVWLAAQPGNGALVRLPFTPHENGHPVYLYATQVHHKPFVGSVLGAFLPPLFQRLQPVLQDFPSPTGVAALRALGVQWIQVNTTAYSDYASVHARMLSAGLRLVAQHDSEWTYELPAAP